MSHVRTFGVPERALLHPLWLTALFVLVVNDHALKAAWPGFVTGKLSDVAGLLVAPALLATLTRARTRRVHALAHGAVAAVFAAINLFPVAARAWEALMALGPLPWRVAVDPTDLLTLPALIVSWRVLVPAAMAPPWPSSALRRAAPWAVAAVGLVASMATSPPNPGGTVAATEFGANALVNRSGLQVLVRVRSLELGVTADCSVVMAAPRDVLLRDYFGPADVLLLQPNGVYLLEEPGLPGDCAALLIDGDGLPMRLVTWHPSLFIVQSIALTADGSHGDEALFVDPAGDGLTLTSASSKYAIEPPPPVAVEVSDGACAPSSAERAVQWATPAPMGTHRIAALEVAPHGCLAVELEDPGEPVTGLRPDPIRWNACLPPLAWPFEEGDVLSIVETTTASGARSVALASDAWEVRAGIGSSALGPSGFVDGDVAFMADPECPFAHEATCYDYVRPLVFAIAPSTAPLSQSPDTAIPYEDGSLFVVRAFESAVVNGPCSGSVAGAITVESVFVRPSSAQGGEP